MWMKSLFLLSDGKQKENFDFFIFLKMDGTKYSRDWSIDVTLKILPIQTFSILFFFILFKINFSAFNLVLPYFYIPLLGKLSLIFFFENL